MALTPAEKQKAYRQRKAAEAQKRAHETEAFLQTPFDEWMGDRWEDVTHDLDLVGIREIIEFPGKGNVDPFWQEEWNEGPNRGAIGAAERMVGVFLDAAVTLAEKINRYKIEEIGRRIADIEAADLSDAAIRKQALADVARLSKYRDELAKSVRWSLPQWKATGE